MNQSQLSQGLLRERRPDCAIRLGLGRLNMFFQENLSPRRTMLHDAASSLKNDTSLFSHQTIRLAPSHLS